TAGIGDGLGTVDALIVGPGEEPELFADTNIVSRDACGGVDQELRLAAEIGNKRRTVTGVLASCLPDALARMNVVGCQRNRAPRRTDDYEVIHDQGRRTNAVGDSSAAVVVQDVYGPNGFAVGAIETIQQSGRTERVNPATGDGRRRSR